MPEFWRISATEIVNGVARQPVRATTVRKLLWIESPHSACGRNGDHFHRLILMMSGRAGTLRKQRFSIFTSK